MIEPSLTRTRPPVTLTFCVAALLGVGFSPTTAPILRHSRVSRADPGREETSGLPLKRLFSGTSPHTRPVSLREGSGQRIVGTVPRTMTAQEGQVRARVAIPPILGPTCRPAPSIPLRFPPCFPGIDVPRSDGLRFPCAGPYFDGWLSEARARGTRQGLGVPQP